MDDRKKQPTMTNIILCGGSGTRLWPISRTLMPKQFIKLFCDKSLFQLTVERNSKICNSQLIVSSEEQYFLALDQLEELGSKYTTSNTSYLLEPIGRNTAPAIALACLSLENEDIVLVTPSDHLIKNQEKYENALQKAKELASEDNLVTFGIKPDFAEVGFGYIQAKPQNDKCSILNVELFKEKPNLETAERYLEENSTLNIQNLPSKYYWNSGMFCFKAGIFLEELKKYSPKIYKTSKIAFENSINHNFEQEIKQPIRIKTAQMQNIPKESIDYAVMEKSKKTKVVPSDIEWSDVGSFDALSKEMSNDKNNNLIISDKLVKTIDIQDTLIVDTGDALLISKKGSSQKVKEIVDALKSEKSDLPDIHLTGYRPWGTYTVLENAQGYKIKRIEVKQGKRLSLQKHKYRNEHWIVVSGKATVTINKDTFVLNENESTYIKAGDIHRLSNDTNELLVIIEAQVGSYTGEDDIERLDDDFKRS